MIGLLVGRFHALTRSQAAWIQSLAADPALERIVCTVGASDHKGTRRNPLPAEDREAMLRPVLGTSGKPFDLVRVPGLTEDAAWVDHMAAAVLASTGHRLTPEGTVVHTANRDVVELFQKAGYRVALSTAQGLTPFELVQRIVDGKPWKDEATPSTVAVFERVGAVQKIREIFAQKLLNDDGELGAGRDFSTYTSQMDASLAQKLEDLVPFVVPGRIVDKGCGTGKLLVELTRRFAGSSFVGVDLSRELLRRSDENTYASDDVTLIFGNVTDAQIEPGTASTVIFSSIMHEVYSYSGYDLTQIDRALTSAARELRTGGRVLVRDGVSAGPSLCRMRFLSPEVDALFERFSRDFKHGAGVPFERLSATEVRLTAHLANEFLCKKDYLENWHIEVHEEYGAHTVEGWKDAFARTGFRPVSVVAYVNPWIAKHRYEGAVTLTDDAGRSLAWPATNVIAVGEKV